MSPRSLSVLTLIAEGGNHYPLRRPSSYLSFVVGKGGSLLCGRLSGVEVLDQITGGVSTSLDAGEVLATTIPSAYSELRSSLQAEGGSATTLSDQQGLPLSPPGFRPQFPLLFLLLSAR